MGDSFWLLALGAAMIGAIWLAVRNKRKDAGGDGDSGGDGDGDGGDGD